MNIYAELGTDTVILTLRDSISNLTSTQTFSFDATGGNANIIQGSLLFPLNIRAMAVAGGRSSSAQFWFAWFQLSLK